MHITVKLFALMREKAGTDTVPLEIPERASVAQALAVLQAQYPVLQPYVPRARFAVRTTFVDAAALLCDGDELVIIPPVSGGY